MESDQLYYFSMVTVLTQNKQAVTEREREVGCLDERIQMETKSILLDNEVTTVPDCAANGSSPFVTLIDLRIFFSSQRVTKMNYMHIKKLDN